MLLFLFPNHWHIFLIPAVIAHILNSIAEVVIPIGIPTKEVKAEMETPPVIEEPKVRNCSE